jgi:hypothetical protein
VAQASISAPGQLGFVGSRASAFSGANADRCRASLDVESSQPLALPSRDFPIQPPAQRDSPSASQHARWRQGCHVPCLACVTLLDPVELTVEESEKGSRLALVIGHRLGQSRLDRLSWRYDSRILRLRISSIPRWWNTSQCETDE